MTSEAKAKFTKSACYGVNLPTIDGLGFVRPEDRLIALAVSKCLLDFEGAPVEISLNIGGRFHRRLADVCETGKVAMPTPERLRRIVKCMLDGREERGMYGAVQSEPPFNDSDWELDDTSSDKVILIPRMISPTRRQAPQ